ncbi:MAG TPA: lysophospholipid acyltransferase family protein [Gemmatales bacterium]|nr:lysophospholipid acyltransferase family protein [Gemmatales bacterium]
MTNPSGRISKPLSWSRRIWHWLAFYFFGFLFFFGNSFRRFGMHRVPKDGPFLIVCNHESLWDPPMAGVTLSRPVSYMARKTLFDNPLLAAMITRQGGFAVDLEGVGLDGIKTTLKRLEDGEGVLVFPEGTRSRDGNMLPFLKGIVLLIRRAKVPVLPVGIAGNYHAWPPKYKLPRWSPLWCRANPAAMSCYIGELIPAETLLAMKPDEMIRFLENAVASARAEAQRRQRKR